ncbi:histone deacetylase family protein [Pleionea sp. CnH1-48]|uniref:histone deacetylase family protein n=1 Tax=Pleionea sp. CnH1-48 TaxID=2954494 RepID=UPI002096C26C|nr:histone deacetylase family protein [Pleionea sp. CnH1-48]MCO7225663.1 histone deacetylase family protein [Pleionea sp. CnH1-48]
MGLYYLYHQHCLAHEMGNSHPEAPARLNSIENALQQCGLWDAFYHVKAQPATQRQLQLAHQTEYLDYVLTHAPSQGYLQLDADTQMNSASLKAALLAAGSGPQALDLIAQGEVQRAFCAMRPPGHHAEHNKAMGFCIFNNIAITALYARQQGYERVAIIDFDVHHGNGTENIVAGKDGLWLCSTFQSPLYPFSGEEPLADNIFNIPLPAATGSEDIRTIWREQVIPAIADYAPDLLLVSAGFDAHQDDPLAQLNLTDDDYAYFGETLKAQAQATATGKGIAFLEGGYQLQALGRSVAAFLQNWQ